MTPDTWNLFVECCDTPSDLVDRYLTNPARAVDVIIPVKHATPFWKFSLRNFYAQIPIARLLIGDGGMRGDVRATLQEFPRVHIIDQHHRFSLGYCIRELIEHVETEWFVYLHDDVCLPDGWFDAMARHQGDFDWFECYRQKIAMIRYVDVRQNAAERPYSGSQMGCKRAFEPFLAKIDDDYLFRNEDLVLRSLIEEHGGRYARVADTYHCHYHHPSDRVGALDTDVTGVTVTKVVDPEREQTTWDTQARGIIKYAAPDRKYLIWQVQHSVARLCEHGILDTNEFLTWTAATNPAWLPYVRTATHRTFALRGELGNIARSLSRIARILFSRDAVDREDTK